MRDLVMNYGSYRRYEVVRGLEVGTVIRFNQKQRDQSTGIAKLIKPFRDKKKKKVVVMPDIFLSLHGFSLGKPIIKVRKADGTIETTDALGYQFAEGEKRGQPICSCVVCSQYQQYETTKENTFTLEEVRSRRKVEK